MPVILTTQKAEIRRIMVQSQPEQIIFMRTYLGKTHHKRRAGGVAQGVVVPEFKLQPCKKIIHLHEAVYNPQCESLPSSSDPGHGAIRKTR
jgi:hypothetical protein